MNWRTLLWKAGLGFYALLWYGGVVSYFAWGGPPDRARWTTPVFLSLGALLTLVQASREDRRFLVQAGVIGLIAEILGVGFEIPFGAYHYTGTLGPRWMNVPVVMAAAWILLVGYVHAWQRSRWISALWLTAVDFLIDPLAAGPLGFWKWANPGWYYGIPWTNFLGWLVVSVVIFSMAPRQGPPQSVCPQLGGTVILFFSLLALRFKMWGPLGVGIALLAIHILRWSSHTRQSPENIAPIARA